MCTVPVGRRHIAEKQCSNLDPDLIPSVDPESHKCFPKREREREKESHVLNFEEFYWRARVLMRIGSGLNKKPGSGAGLSKVWIRSRTQQSLDPDSAKFPEPDQNTAPTAKFPDPDQNTAPTNLKPRNKHKSN